MSNENRYNLSDLKLLQNLPLERKIIISKLRICEWYEYWKGKVCVSYSGGKDSTVLLRIVRELYPEVPAVYVDTRLDFPSVREHVKETENVIFLKPKMTFREVIDKYGFCYPSKDVAQAIEGVRHGSESYLKKFMGQKANGIPDIIAQRNYSPWMWLINSPIKISAKCCGVMKEKPLDEFCRKKEFSTYVGTMAAESLRRRTAWYKTGCNSFGTKQSKPLSFWREQDILQYIVENNVKIPSDYGEIFIDKKGKYSTTGEKRTGCIFCPIGSHIEKPNRFLRLKENYPNLYHYCMNELGLDEFLQVVGVPH